MREARTRSRKRDRAGEAPPGIDSAARGLSHSGMLLTTLALSTSGQGLYEFTGRACAFVRDSGETEGLLTAFVRHTSASLLIQENADPDVRTDLEAFLRRLVPPADDPSMAYLLHRQEGPDDMPAHVKAALTQTSIAIPVANGRPMLGTWQGIYLFEHRDRPHRREVVLSLVT